MNSSSHVTLLATKHLVENFRKKKGMNFSEALRFIIEDYFKIQDKLDKVRNADFDKVCDLILNGSEFDHAIAEDHDSMKTSLNEIVNMLLVIGNADNKLRTEFVKYFPKYFKKN